MSMRPQQPPQVPELTVRTVRAAFPKGTLAVRMRDELGGLFEDAAFASAFGARGKPGISPGCLAMVTVLQFVEDLTDRQAAEAVRSRIDWKYALGMELDDAGFDFSVLSGFRARLAEHGLEQVALDALLTRLRGLGLVSAGGRQRSDSTHVVSAVRDLNRLELAGESVRAALEALAVAAPDWLGQTLELEDWNARYGARIDSWRLPNSQAKRDALAQDYGTDAVTLLRAVYSPTAPGWLGELPAVDVLRVMLVQNYRIDTTQGREVIRRRETGTDGLPPGRTRLSSPYDTDSRWAAKGDDLFWNGYKIHISETCDQPAGSEHTGHSEAPQPGHQPNIITHVATTHAAVPDVAMTAPIHQGLAARDLLPTEHYVDSGYPSVDLLGQSRREHGVTLVSPLLADTSAQARAGTGYDRTCFTIDFDAKQATCPQGQHSSWWNPCRQRGTDAIVITFDAATCAGCPVRAQCTNAVRNGRQLTVPPREAHQAQTAARAEQDTTDWRARYATRAGIEGTINQAITTTGTRHARYRGLPKTRLQHAFSATALNIIRLDTYWTGHPLDRTRTSHLTRLHYTLAA